MVASDEPMTEFAQLLRDLDRAIEGVNEGTVTDRAATVLLLAVFKNINERLSKLERFQEGR